MCSACNLILQLLFPRKRVHSYACLCATSLAKTLAVCGVQLNILTGCLFLGDGRTSDASVSNCMRPPSVQAVWLSILDVLTYLCRTSCPATCLKVAKSRLKERTKDLQNNFAKNVRTYDKTDYTQSSTPEIRYRVRCLSSETQRIALLFFFFYHCSQCMYACCEAPN